MLPPNQANRTTFAGDIIDIMRGKHSKTDDLIYLAPPIYSNKTYFAPVRSKAAGAAFKDTWTLCDLDFGWMGLIADQQAAYILLETAALTHGKGMQSCLCMVAVRLVEMRRLLKSTGSICLHCDPYASYYLKMLMDSTFGPSKFKNGVVWKRTSGHSDATRYSDVHDTFILIVHLLEHVLNSLKGGTIIISRLRRAKTTR